MKCNICGRGGEMVGKVCSACYAVQYRLETYMATPEGLRHVCKLLPKVDDWLDDWNYEAVLKDNDVLVVSTEVGGDDMWSLSWSHGVIGMGNVRNQEIARKGAAMFVTLYLRGFSTSLSDNLMDGYMTFLERQI